MPDTPRDIVKRYLEGLDPEQLVVLLIEVHGADAGAYLAILAAEASVNAGREEATE